MINMKFPTMEEFAKDVAEKALDEYKYKGKTLRQWIEIIFATASADTISRRAAIEAVGKLCDGCDNSGWCGECRIDHPDKDAIDVLEALPPAGTQIIYCKDCKHFIREDKEEYTSYGFYNTYFDAFCDKHWDNEQGEYINVKLDDFCSFAERKEQDG